MGQIVFGKRIICPNCKVTKGRRTVYGRGYRYCSRQRALANGWKIKGWKGEHPLDTVKVICPTCDGAGMVEWQTPQT